MDNKPEHGGGTALEAAEALRRDLAGLIEESKALRRDVQTEAEARARAEKARRRSNAINMGLLTLLAVFVAMQLVVTVQNNRLNKQINGLTATMADCTTPGGKCYSEGSRRTGNAIADVVRGYMFMAQCARLFPNESGPEYDAKLEKCTFERMAAYTAQRNAQTNPTPSPSPTAPR